MTERGLPISDGAPACPFVAFADDRDERATSPDHRHRCYAEPKPAPRALAHQEAYCLASAFPVCPTFQDWARREAARARESSAAGGAQLDRDPTPVPQRNPPRDWAAPPPWAAGEGEDAADEVEGEFRVLPARGGGLAGSYADRVASGEDAAERSPATPPPPPPRGGPSDVTPPQVAAPVPDVIQGAAAEGRAQHRHEGDGPEWEAPPRMEAFPAIRTRRLAELSISPILLAFVALLLASAAMFALPGLLGFGGPGGPAASPTPSEAPATIEPTLEPTPVPEPTLQIYIVQGGDTMSKIANRFGVSLQALIDANADNIPDPNRLQIGDEVIIPSAVPTEIPGEVPAAS
jgi:LysM repeat protein